MNSAISNRPSPCFNFLKTLRGAREGDEASLQALFERFYPSVRRQVHFSLAKDLRIERPWLASLFSTGDVVQEVFSNVLGDLYSFKGKSEQAFAGYLTMVVRNRLIDTIRFHQAARRDRRRVRVVNEEIEANEPISRRRGPATRVTSSEQQALFQAALKNFEERERILLRERLECQTAYQALADRLGYPTADAARKAFSTARSRLLVILQRSGVGEIN